jgi:hypothetical protein
MLVMHGGQLLLLEAAYRYTYTRVTLAQTTIYVIYNNFQSYFFILVKLFEKFEKLKKYVKFKTFDS